MKKNIIALILSVVLVSTAAPMGVLAVENTGSGQDLQSTAVGETEDDSEGQEEISEQESDGPESSIAADNSETADEESAVDDNAGEESGAGEGTDGQTGGDSADAVPEAEKDAEGGSSEEPSSMEGNDAAEGETDAAQDENSAAQDGTAAEGLTDDAGKTPEEAANEADLTIRTGSRHLYMNGVQKDLGDPDDLYEEYANSLFYKRTNPSAKARKAPRVSAGSRLTGNDRAVYDKMRETATLAANGELDDTLIEIPFTELGIEERMYSAKELGLSDEESLLNETGDDISAEAEQGILASLAYDFGKVTDCLSADCAYELYWSKGAFGSGAALSYSFNSEGVDFSTSTLVIYMYVAPQYRMDEAEETSVDTGKTGAASSAAALAAEIVRDAAGMSDLDKLTYYKEQICELVSYDHSAAGSTGQKDRSPWALINVFDGDPDTNVVCEGYSEAFQYLGSLTAFDSSKVCVYSVTGTMSGGTGAGPHKWNIVRMNDGLNYIADITNSDEDSIGSDGKLFLTGMTGSPQDEYVKAWKEREVRTDYDDGSYSITTYPGGSITYEYDGETLDIFTEEELTLSANDYLETETPAEIVGQPSDVEARKGETVEFTVEAEGERLAYQWQWSADGNTWKDCASGSYDTDTFSFVMQARFKDRKYRCVVSAGDEILISDAATVSLFEPVKIVEQPRSVTAAVGDQVVFTVDATGENLSYQWQYSVNGSYWSNCTSGSYNTDSFGFVMQSRFAGRRYRCIVSADGESVTSSAALLTLIEKNKIVTQPEDISVAAGKTATFHVEATGEKLSYQWQYSLNGSYWSNCSGSGHDTDTFSFVMQKKFSGRQYRCVVTADGETLTSKAATVSLKEAGKIVGQPESISAAIGERASFHVEFSGEDPAYQWQYSVNGSYWGNCTGGSYNTDTFSFVMQERFAGRQYRCIIKAGGETYTSAAATVSIAGEELIEAQPEDVTVAAGKTASFHVGASASGAKYQWQWSADNVTWKNCTGSGYNTDTFSFTAQQKYSGRYYRCKVTSGQKTEFSDGGLLTVAK